MSTYDFEPNPEDYGPEPTHIANGTYKKTLLVAPPKREWVELTSEDMDFLFPHGSSAWVQETVKIIEAKLKEKNT
jgi:hypothetical protein